MYRSLQILMMGLGLAAFSLLPLNPLFARGGGHGGGGHHVEGGP